MGALLDIVVRCRCWMVLQMPLLMAPMLINQSGHDVSHFLSLFYVLFSDWRYFTV